MCLIRTFLYGVVYIISVYVFLMLIRGVVYIISVFFFLLSIFELTLIYGYVAPHLLEVHYSWAPLGF
jgi:hypothetical protein